MKKLLILILVLLAPVFFVKEATAQSENGTSQRWVCLDATKTSGHEAVIEAKGGKDSTDANNRPVPNAKTFIVECITGGHTGGQKCTTGNSSVDEQIFGKDMVKELQKSVNYGLDYVKPPDDPVTSDATGYVGPITWGSHTLPGTNHRWMAMNYYTPQTLKCNTPGAQQQCTFSFDSVSGKCISIGWDPKGTVFDSVSLEPVPNVNVQLFVEDNGQYVPATIKNTQSVIENPYKTVSDGQYEFYVQPGNYKLSINDPRYSFVANPKIDPNWTKAYGISPSALYHPGDVITQTSNETEYRDVPLQPVGQPYHGNTVLMDDGFINLDKVNDIMTIQDGVFSHPFTKVFICKNGFAKTHPDKTQVCSDPTDPNKIGPDGLAVTDADRLGQFTVDIPLANIQPSDLPLIIRGRKVPLTNVNPSPQGLNIFQKITTRFISFFGGKEVKAQDITEDTIDPILNNIQGYAYDASGVLLPGATVGVYFTYSNKPYYQTTADSKGFYKISSDNLPDMPYNIRYTSNGGTTFTTITTSQFISQNQKYLTDGKVNLFTFVDSNGKRPTSLPPQNTSGTKDVNFYANKPVNLTPQEQSARADVLSSQANMVLITLILLILLLLTAGGIFFYLKKKGAVPPTELPY